MNREELYRSIPKVDVLLETDVLKAQQERYGHESLMAAIREETEALRKEIASLADDTKAQETAEKIRMLPERIKASLGAMHTPRMKRVINATGVILHTNLGRAVMDEARAKELTGILSSYSNLEYNLDLGERGERYAHVESLLRRLTGAEAVMVVNNNAAAVLLALSALAKGGEVIVSRGELVEIGGKFRIPDVCEQSGAFLREVGTTNKTHLEDYERALTEETKAILKVHTSNFAQIGFTESVPHALLKPLCEKQGIPLIEDLGSGVLVDLGTYGIRHPEPTVQQSVSAGADLVCFSGDKLLGGPQAGILVGKKELIDKCKKHPLTRVLRVDKMTVAALELTLLEYLNPETVAERIPVLRMLKATEEEMKEKAERLRALLLQEGVAEEGMTCEPCFSQVGGGSLPLEELPSAAVVLRPAVCSAQMLERRMRGLHTPVIARTQEDAVWLDVRTVPEEDFEAVAKSLAMLLR